MQLMLLNITKNEWGATGKWKEDIAVSFFRDYPFENTRAATEAEG